MFKKKKSSSHYKQEASIIQSTNDSQDLFDEKGYLKHMSEKVFTVKYRERSTGRIFEVNPNINDAYFDTIYRNMFRSGEYVLIGGELPAKWQ